MSKIIFISAVLFCPKFLYSQYGLDRFPSICPDQENILVGYPTLEYFKHFGNSYIQIFYEDLGYPRVFKSTYKLKNDRIVSKAKSPYKRFPTTRRYKVVNNEIKHCNRFGSIQKWHYYSKSKTEVTGNDSITYEWTYLIVKTDTIVVRSERRTFSQGRLIIRYESARDFYAFNDSTWILAEQGCKSGYVCVTRSTFQYISDNEIKTTYESISKQNHDTIELVLKFIYDPKGILTEIEYCFPKSKSCDHYKFYYENGLCVAYECIRDDKKILEKITTTKK